MARDLGLVAQQLKLKFFLKRAKACVKREQMRYFFLFNHG